MAERILAQLLTLSLFTVFMGFCFCDGFRLHILRKLAWFIAFLALSINTLKAKGEFELTSILPASIALAFILCAYEKIKSDRKVK
jgi:hypothetical protein